MIETAANPGSVAARHREQERYAREMAAASLLSPELKRLWLNIADSYAGLAQAEEESSKRP